MKDHFLDNIQSFLRKEGMDCAILEDEEKIMPRLVVYLGVDHKHRERTLEIEADEQVLPAFFKDAHAIDVQEGFYRLQIQSPFPIACSPTCAAQMASAANYLNTMLELPGIIFDEVHNILYYRTVHMTATSDLKEALLLGIVGMHRMVLDIFTDLLEQIGNEELSFLEWLDEIAKRVT